VLINTLCYGRTGQLFADQRLLSAKPQHRKANCNLQEAVRASKVMSPAYVNTE
jgi:hypothetical protein